MNRHALREALNTIKQQTSKKGRGPKRSHLQPRIDPIGHALAGAATLTKVEQTRLAALPRSAIEALQFGRFTDDHFRALADAWNIGQELAKPPVNLCNDHAPKFAAGLSVLLDLSEQQSQKLGTWTARAEQLATMKEALVVYQIQLTYVCRQEWGHALERLKRRHEQALRGNAGGARVLA